MLRPLATLATLVLCLVLLGTPRHPAEAAPPPDAAAIDAAIERGVAWLLAEQRAAGPWGSGDRALGRTALSVFTLLHSGLAEDQPGAQGRRLARALRWLERNGAGRSTRRERDTRTYEASLLLMLLRARGRAEDRERMQRLARLLVSTQARNGQWWYDGDGAPHQDAGDNSNTQFAVLALGQAHGEGLEVPSATFERARGWWLRCPQEGGGFGYSSGGSTRSAVTGSMTAAGLCCLAVTRAVLGETAGDREVARGAHEHLGRIFSVTRNHGPATDRQRQRQRHAGRGWLHYYLWTVERAMVLGGHERLGARDWYAEGAAHLLRTQKRDGSWRGEHPLYATCFALLFLTRAADPPRAFTPSPPPAAPRAPAGPVTPREGEAPAPQDTPATPPGSAAEAPPPPGRVQDWLLEELPPGALAARCRLAGAGSLLPLVHALQHPQRDVRRRAFEALGALLPPGRVARVDRHPLPRGRLALWLRLDARHLVLRDEVFRLP